MDSGFPKRDDIPATILTEEFGLCKDAYFARCCHFFEALFKTIQTEFQPVPHDAKPESVDVFIRNWNEGMCSMSSRSRATFFEKVQAEYNQVDRSMDFSIWSHRLTISAKSSLFCIVFSGSLTASPHDVMWFRVILQLRINTGANNAGSSINCNADISNIHCNSNSNGPHSYTLAPALSWCEWGAGMNIRIYTRSPRRSPQVDSGLPPSIPMLSGRLVAPPLKHVAR
ncbi:hypothetical protein BJ138DRAFT_1115786 [Hygrophoropsis aurantiaca]|uniref:Uncharacterized protein n=1 Tax=Hygrophoropsis aurantiaca TaxID=72124 RepID=A0ACB8A5B9_9AGAM|nr:hypothetical protein BJ138DRAFT_1115786 [Hygrophoropsis aurantiaca]